MVEIIHCFGNYLYFVHPVPYSRYIYTEIK
jgi:hypothetical protein